MDSRDAGRVILAGTPLGQPADASTRLRDALASAPVIAAEDTRRLQRLCKDLGVTPAGRVLSFFDGNETGRVPQLLDALRAGEDVLVVTDAGMPSVSDPGYRLVSSAIAEGIDVTALPGPSAVTTAVALSGLPVERFCFEGFLPRKPGERRRATAALAAEPRTMVFFEAPHRLAATLADLADAMGPDRAAAVCRELTKTYEEVKRAPLGELATWAEGDVRGEITIVVAGATPAAAEVNEDELASEVEALVATGTTRKDAIAEVAAHRGLPKKVVYAAATRR
jgi:16S rRNA (cytidine1402-2'-O)-methyltransferase